MRHTLTTLLTAGSIFGIFSLANAAPSITVYLSAPDAQVAPAAFTNLSVETFSGLSTASNNTAAFVSTIGTYTGTFRPTTDDQYGNGTGNYFTFGAQSGTGTPVSLAFTNPIAYFGFAYCAGDGNNGITFYDNNNVLLGRFSTSTLLTVLNNGQGTLTATDSTVYNTSQYFGKPITGDNSPQPYSFVNFFFSGGTVGRIVFDNSNSTGSGFESDNHTISTTPQTTTGTPFVFVGSVTIVPEANTATLLALAAIPVLGVLRARRRK